MALRVVHLLEMIQVNEDERKLVSVPLGTVNLRLEDETHVTRVVKRRAIVCDGQFVNALYVTRIFKRDCRKVRERFEQLQIS